MKLIFTFLTTFILSFNCIAQINSSELAEFKISDNSSFVTTTIIGEFSNEVVAFQTNSEENSISVGTINSDDNFQSIKKEMLKDNNIENVFLRGNKVAIFTSNLSHLNNQEFKKNEEAPKVDIDLIEINLDTKENKLSKNFVQFEYINNATYYEGQLRIEQSENQQYLGICYGFVRGYSKPKKFKSYVVILDADLNEINSITWESDREMQEVKRYDQILISNEAEMFLVTLSNYSQKMKAIYPVYNEIIMKDRSFENELPGLTNEDDKRTIYASKQVAVNYIDKNSTEPKVYNIDFEDKLHYVSNNGFKLKMDSENNVIIAGLFSDGFNNLFSKGVFIGKINFSSDEMEILYKEYFTAQFIDEILPNEKLKTSAKTKIQKGKNPYIDNVVISNLVPLENDDFAILLEYENIDKTNTKFADFDKKNESYEGNMQLLKFTENGTKLDWSLEFTKKNYRYMPKSVIGSNRSYIKYFPSSSSLILMYNQQNANQTPKPSSVLGVDIDYPKLFVYNISNSGELRKKQQFSNNSGAIIHPEKSIKIGQRFFLQGKNNEIQKFFELK